MVKGDDSVSKHFPKFPQSILDLGKMDLNLSFSIKMYSVMCDSNDTRKLSMES